MGIISGPFLSQFFILGDSNTIPQMYLSSEVPSFIYNVESTVILPISKHCPQTGTLAM